MRKASTDFPGQASVARWPRCYVDLTPAAPWKWARPDVGGDTTLSVEFSEHRNSGQDRRLPAENLRHAVKDRQPLPFPRHSGNEARADAEGTNSRMVRGPASLGRRSAR